jgi:general stress protein 26
MNLQEVFRFMNTERLGVLTTATKSGQPQAALMGFAVTPELEIIFDTVRSSRKYTNLKGEPAGGLRGGLYDNPKSRRIEEQRF